MAPGVQKLQASELPIKLVTVYTDRAELLRTFKVVLEQGVNSVVVENVSPRINPDSIRVDGRGDWVTLQQVKFKRGHATAEEVDSPEVKQLVERVKKLEGELHKAQTSELVYQKQVAALDSLLAEKLDKISLADQDFDKLAGRVSTLRAIHSEQMMQLASSYPEVKERMAECSEEIEKSKKQIAALRSNPNKVTLAIHIALDAEKKCEAEVELTYQVSGSSWKPSYDLRVESLAKGVVSGVSTPATTARLYYYSNVQQCSGEDWNDVKLVLSTAQPRSGGALPELGTLVASFWKPPPPPPSQEQMTAPRQFLFGGGSRVGYNGYVESPPVMMMQSTAAPCPPPPPPPPQPPSFAVEQFRVERQLLSTSFSIEQNKSIPSDGADHRVTVALISLSPLLLHHHCVPCKNTNVFLMASAINTSGYPLLRGDASIYLDGTFNSKAVIKGVECGERMDLPLGTDATVKLEYKPSHESRGQAGFLSHNSATIHEQQMTVKNTNAKKAVRLTIYEHIPKATDERIKVELCCPEGATKEVELESEPQNTSDNTTMTSPTPQLKQPEVGVVVNAENNLKWTVALEPSEKKDLTVGWKVTYPNSERVEYKERK